MTWTLKDAADSGINLASYSGKDVYVVIFSSNDTEACKLLRCLADHVSKNPNLAKNVLAICTDDSGDEALKQYIRQEEWTSRVAAWNAEQEVARAAAKAAGEEYSAETMPDLLQAIKDDLADPNELKKLMKVHFPFNTCCRCDKMWDWLCVRMASPTKAPRILKFDSAGIELAEWSNLPAELGGN
jgi:hypothetical protein